MNWHDIFEYRDGKLYWSIKPSVAVSCGSEAGHISENGYIRFRCKGRNYMAHRIIWEMINGQINEGVEIDHINHKKTDNRIENLRPVSKADNMKNQPKSSRNKSGVVGVRFNQRRGFWEADIRVNRKLHHLGLYSSMDDAISARIDAVKMYGFHKNHGGTSE